MGQTILGVIFGIIVGVMLFGFTIWVGLAIIAMTISQPSDVVLSILLVVALLVAIGSGVFVGRRLALRRPSSSA